MSSASSNQSVIRDGAEYEEVYSFSHKDPESLGEERSPSAFSSSSTNEDTEMVEVEETFDDSKDLPLGPVICADGLREFIMLLEWTVHKFNSRSERAHV